MLKKIKTLPEPSYDVQVTIRIPHQVAEDVENLYQRVGVGAANRHFSALYPDVQTLQRWEIVQHIGRGLYK